MSDVASTTVDDELKRKIAEAQTTSTTGATVSTTETNLDRFERSFQYLDDSRELEQFDTNKRKELAELMRGYQTRDAMIAGVPVSEPQVRAEKPARAAELKNIDEPPLGWKANRRKNRAISRTKKAALKETSHASDYTGMIMEAEQQRIDQKEDVSPAVTIPQGDMQQDGNPLSDVSKAWKQKIFAMKFNQGVFETEYFGMHFRQIQGELSQLNRFLDSFGHAKPAFQKLSLAEQLRVNMLEETAILMNDCFEKALKAHSIKLTDRDPAHPETDVTKKKLEYEKGASPNAASDLSQAMHALGRKLNDAEDLNRRYKDKYDKQLADLRTRTAQMQTTSKQKYPRVKGNFATEKDYKKIDALLGALDAPENAQRVAANRAVIDKVLADYIHMKQAYGEQYLRNEAGNELVGVEEQKYGTNKDNYDPDSLAYISALSDITMEPYERMQAFESSLTMYEDMLDHLIYGKEDLSETEYRILKKNGHKPAADYLKQESDAAMMYPYSFRLRSNLLSQAKQRYQQNHPNEAQRLNSFAAYRFADVSLLMLAGQANEVRNDRALEMFLKTDQLRQAHVGSDGSAGAMTQAAYDSLKASCASVTEQVLSERVQTIMGFKIPNIHSIPPDRMLDFQVFLKDYINPQNWIKAFGDNPSDVAGLTVMEKLLEKPDPQLATSDLNGYRRRLRRYNARKAAFDVKVDQINHLIKQARAAAIFTAGAGEYDDPGQFLTEREESHYSYQNHRSVNAESVIKLGRAMMRTGTTGMERSIKELRSSGAIQSWLESKQEENLTETRALSFVPRLDKPMSDAEKTELKALYQQMRDHYDGLEDKYNNGELPDLAWSLLHRDELREDLKYAFMDYKLIVEEIGLDKEDPEDARLIHQVAFFYHLYQFSVRIPRESIARDADSGLPMDTVWESSYREDRRGLEEHGGYLKEHPKKKKEQKKEGGAA